MDTRRLRALFDRMLAVPPDARARWLAREVADPLMRARLADLAAADLRADPLLDDTGRLHAWALDDDGGDAATGPAPGERAASEAMVGRRVGAFELLGLLGRGGMARVHLARRCDADFDQRVAVKLLHRDISDPVEQHLFRRERRILARLQHPDIARLIDGGVDTDGTPYLVIEHVDGVPLLAHAAGLDWRARLALFVRIARAVQAAHAALVVHGDLKPGNVLVTRAGDPKVLDFGIARVIGDDEHGEEARLPVRATPAWASPERLAGAPASVAGDVYSLGLLLAALLEGTAAPASVRADLERVVARATRAQPGLRHEAAGRLADDVADCLDGRLPRSLPAPSWRRAVRVAGRHRLAFTVILGLTVALFGTLVVALRQADQASRQALLAGREATRANTVRDFLEQLFEPVREGVSLGRMPALPELVAAGLARLSQVDDLGPAERVDLLLLFSRLSGNLGDRAQALALGEQAHDQARIHLEPRHPLAIAALARQARLHLANGHLAPAESLLNEAAERLRGGDPDDPAWIDVLDDLGVLAMERDDREAALAHKEQALAARIRRHGVAGKSTAAGWNNLGYALVGVGRHRDAADAYERAHAIDLRHRDPGSYDVLNTLSNWGWALVQAGESRSARPLLAQVDDGLQQVPGQPRGLHLVNLQKLCLVDIQLALPEASDSCGRMLALSAGMAGVDSPGHGDSLSFEGLRLLGRGALSEAADHLSSAWARLPDPVAHRRNRARVERLRAEIDLHEQRPAAALERLLGLRGVFDGAADRAAAVLVEALSALACQRARADCADPTALHAVRATLDGLAQDRTPGLTLPRLVLALAVAEASATAEARALAADAATDAASALGEAHPWVRALQVLADPGAAATRCDPPGAASDPWLQAACTCAHACVGR